MYQLLIVEDEKWEREGLCDFLDWNRMGIELAGCAGNGSEGLKMAEVYQPDIIITDIKMPKMDGIQMSQGIRTFLPDAKIIILSGYDDFEYAKQSIGFRACSYILKPVEKKALEEALFRALEALDLESSRKREMDTLQCQWNNYFSKDRSGILLNLMGCKAGSSNANELASISELEMQGKKTVVILSLFRSSEKEQPLGVLPHISDPEMINAFCMLLENRNIIYSYNAPYKKAVLCMDAQGTKAELKMNLLQLLEILKEELGIEAIAGVGEAVESFFEISQSFAQAMEADSFVFLAEYGELLFYDKLKEAEVENRNDSRSAILKTSSITKEIVYSIQKCEIDESIQLVDELLFILRKYRLLGKMLLSCFFSEVMNRLNTSLTGEVYENTRVATYDKIWSDLDLAVLDSLPQTKQLIIGFLKGIIVQPAEKKGSKDEEIAKRVIEIIGERYSCDLDLKQISDDIHLSPYYIGNIFKRYTGKVFNQYLCDYRIDMAKEMLQNKKVKVGELAKMVGIKNNSYFCMLFKDRFGISPGKYMEVSKGGREHV